MNSTSSAKPIHVMLDLETLGTKPGCPILSIGATTFLTTVPERFYQVIQEQQVLMDLPDPDTVAWWKQQSEAAQREIFGNDQALDICSSLTLFVQWLNYIKQDPGAHIVIWGKGANFDEPILREAFSRYNIPYPISGKHSMCFRTLELIGKMARIQVPDFIGDRHNALADAEHQAQYAELIFDDLSILWPCYYE